MQTTIRMLLQIITPQPFMVNKQHTYSDPMGAGGNMQELLNQSNLYISFF